ncbi:hypothetical protein BDF22DRAFT_173705 [Syncephalis plumigaleata]|nr:hypothetical protein BDF22DRAFT_173705 [Syncephalis plumigaleata]
MTAGIMSFEGVTEAYPIAMDFNVAPLKLLGVELECKSEKNATTKGGAATTVHRRPGVVQSSRALTNNRHTMNMRVNVAHADPGARRWYVILVQPLLLRRCKGIMPPKPQSSSSSSSNTDESGKEKDKETSTSNVMLSPSLSSSCISLKYPFTNENGDVSSFSFTTLDNMSISDGNLPAMSPSSSSSSPDEDDNQDTEPYTVQRTFYQFRLLIVGLYREFLDRPDITVTLHDAAADIFSTCIEAERLCVHALLDVFLMPGHSQLALLGSRSLAQFFSRWPADRSREELEQNARDINRLFDAWDDLQNQPGQEEQPVYSSKTSVWSMDLTVPTTPDKPNMNSNGSGNEASDPHADTTNAKADANSIIGVPLRRGKSMLASVGMRAMRKAVGKASSIFANGSSVSASRSSTNLTIVTDLDQEQTATATTTMIDTASLVDLPQADDDKSIGELFADELISALEKVSKTDSDKHQLLTKKSSSLFNGVHTSHGDITSDSQSSSSLLLNDNKDNNKDNHWKLDDETLKLLTDTRSVSVDAKESKESNSTTSSFHDYDSNESIHNDCDSGNGPSIASDSRCSSSFELVSSGNPSSCSSLAISSPPTKRSLSIRGFRRKQQAQSNDDADTEDATSNHEQLSSPDVANTSSESSRLSRRLTGSFRVVRKSVIKRVSTKNGNSNSNNNSNGNNTPNNESADDKAPLSPPSVEVTAPLTEMKTTGSVAPRRVASSTDLLLPDDVDAYDSGHMSDIEPRPMTIPVPRSSTPPPSLKLGGRASTSNASERRAVLGKLQAEAPWNARRESSNQKNDKVLPRLSVDVNAAALSRSHSARADVPQRPHTLMRMASNASFVSNASSASLIMSDDSPIRASTAPGTPCSPAFTSPSSSSYFTSPRTPSVYVHPAADDYFHSAMPPASPIDPLCDLPLYDEELAGDIVVQIALDRKHLVRLVVPRSCTLQALCHQAEDKFMRCLEKEKVLQGRELLYVQRDGRALLVNDDAALGRVLARAVDRVAVFRVW